MDRYERQRLLASVGDRGQERIFGASFAVQQDARLSSEVEREYLRRAGAQVLVARSGEPVAFAHAAVFHDAAARELAAGAWRALLQLNSALETVP